MVPALAGAISLDIEHLRASWHGLLGQDPEGLSLPTEATYKPGISEPETTAPETPGEEPTCESVPSFPGFEALEQIGRGGMGRVFRARQNSLRRDVAIKSLTQATPAHKARLRRAFQAEALTSGCLEHPNIIPVHECSRTADGDPFLVMKLVAGEVWESRLRTAGQDSDQVAELHILLTVSNAVAFAHSRGVVHNDLKPQNVMIGAFGEVQLMDWGLAVSIADDAQSSGLKHRSEIIQPCGTPAYMPPELALGDGPGIGPWTDIYQLGGILYRILSGKPPHAGKDFLEVLTCATFGDIAPLPEDLPAGLRSICTKALATAPEDRYADVLEFQEALRSYLRHRESRLISEAAARKLADCAARISSAKSLEREARSQLYSGFAEAVAGFEHARQLWRENHAATEGFCQARMKYAEAALAHGDLVLAEAQLDLLGREEQASRAEVSALRAALEEKRRDRSKLSRRNRLATVLFVVSALVLAWWGYSFFGPGTLDVSTQPPGATILVDNEVRGITPQRLDDVQSGRHLLELRLSGYESAKDLLNLQAGQLLEVDRSLRRQSGYLNLSSAPARVSLDLLSDSGDTVRLSSPAERVSLPIGRYQGNASLVDHFERSTSFEIETGRVTHVYLSLNARTHWQQRLGKHLTDVCIGRLNGDAWPDVIATCELPPRIYAIDGKRGDLMWMQSFEGREDRDPWSMRAVIADLEGDGAAEVVLPDPGTARLLIYDGAGRQVSELDAVGLWVLNAGPLRGPEDALLVGTDDGLLALAGCSGDTLWALNQGGPPGLPVRARLNSDAVPDFLVTLRGDEGRLEGIDGRDGSILWRAPVVGERAAVAVDVDGDGLHDAVQAATDGNLTAVSGRDGAILWRLRLSQGSLRPWGSAGDVDGDGEPEIVQGGAAGGGLRIIDARSGKQQKQLEKLDTGWVRPVICDLNGDGRADVIASDGGELVALDAVSGRRLWTLPRRSALISLLLADLDLDGRQDIVTGDRTGVVRAVLAGEHPVLWRSRDGAWNSNQLIALEGRIFIPGSGVRVLGFDGVRQQIWDEDSEMFCIAAQDLDGDGSAELAAVGKRGLHLLGGRPLRELWRVPGGGHVEVPLFADVNNDHTADIGVGVGGRYGFYDGRDGATLWSDSLTLTTHSTALLHAQVLFLPTKAGLSLRQLASGRQLALCRTRDWPTSPQRSAAGQIIFGDQAGWLYCWDSRSGSLRWERLLDGAPTPFGAGISENLAIVANSSGSVHALDIGSGELCWSLQFEGEVWCSDAATSELDGTQVAALVSANGLVLVLRCTDGAEITRWRVPDLIGWQRLTWHDLDGDARPELLVLTRDELVYALSFKPSRSEPVFWPNGQVSSLEEARARAPGLR